MPSIYLGKQSGLYITTGAVRVDVTDETDSKSLFKKFKHKIKTPIKQNIWLYKGISWYIDFWSSCATLQLQGDYSNSKLEHAEVYFNKFDKNYTALVCLLKFDTGKDFIYKHSEHGEYIDENRSTNITTLTEFTSDKNILDEVLKENDKLTELLTYDIGKKQGDENSNGLYNNKKIQIEDNTSSGVPTLSDGFKRYKHTPVGGVNGKKACVIWNNNLLLQKGGTELQGIQEKTYNYICVYYSDKVFEPLLVEFKENGSSSNTNSKYYYHTWKNGNGDNKTLYWEQIQQGKNVLGVELTGGEDVYSQLTQSNHSKLLELLEKLKSHLQKTIVFMVDKKQGPYDQSTFKTSFPKSSNYRLINQSITPTDKTSSEGKCLENTGFKVYEHDFTTSVKEVQDSKEKVELKILVPNSESSDKYDEITLHKGATDSNGNVETLEYGSSNNKLYVYFYGDEDPRPLLVCYGNDAYKPRNLNSTNKDQPVQVKYSTWEKVTGISTCTCNNGGTSGTNEPLLKALNEVTGFLNPVQINPTQIPDPAKETITAEPRTPPSTKQATYELHTYNTKTIKMGISRNTLTCYKSFKYEPYGTGTGRPAEGYRLGTVLHTKSGYSTQHSRLEYINHTSYQYYPVVGVTVYYYDEDKEYADPLLIELEFKNEGVGAGTDKEYYKLSQTGGSNGTLTWEKDTKAPSAVSSGGGGDNQKLIAHLDSIRHSLKKVVKILIDKQTPYQLSVSQQAGGNGGYTPYNSGGKQIQVEACTEGECSKLSHRGYKCYQHKVSQITGGSGFDYNTIGGLKFYISGKNGGGEKDIEIKLHKSDSEGEIKELLYNTCMGDVYVFFYCKNGTEQGCKGPSPKPPTAPLMLYYNKGYYKPADIDQYFTKWVPETGLVSVTAPCGGDSGPTQLVNKLNEVNKSLNRIYLTQTDGISSGGGSASSTYGISKPSGPPKDPNIVLDRIKVTKIPGKPTQTRPYCKLVHRTMNDFTIGDIYYDTKDIKNGVQINGSGTIQVGNGGGTGDHTEFVNGSGNNKPNTVVAYYHSDDNAYKLPQLIVLLHTDKGIEQGAEPIKASNGSKYGYYVLATNGDGNNYKYEWREPKDPQPKPFKLDEQTEFSLLNSLVVLVEKQTTYNESSIKNAISTSQIKSPGNDDGVNRLKGKEINVKNESGTTAECVKKYGYVLKSHDLSSVTAPIFSIQPILGLRFLIPSTKAEGSYDEIKLHSDDKAEKAVGPLYHTSANNTVYVYFYGKDPRPLLMCYGTDAYIPKKNGEPTVDKQVNVDYTKWTNVDGISQCVCDNGETDSSNKILDTLLKVVLFLNPVQLNPRKLHSFASSQIIPTEPPPTTPKDATYKLHKFTANKTVQMKITRKNLECYEKYTYESNGTSGDKTGFRLGNVIHTNSNLSNSISTLNYLDLRTSFPYDPVVGVSVYYYDHDTKYQEPLLIELDFKVNGVFDTKEYYKLEQVGNSIRWDLDDKAKGEIGDGKDGDNQKIVTYLDTIRYQFKKVLEIKIAIKKTESYEAKLLNRENDKSVEPNEHISVQVTEEKTCPSLTGTGFRCFKHNITGLGSPDLHKFAALQIVIPSQDSTNLVKINLHELSTSGPTDPLYYNCSMGDIYVYFYGGTANSGQPEGDPRPLLLCYNSKGYKATTMVDYDKHKWYQSPTITSCDCTKKDGKLFEALLNVSNFLNPVKILERPTFMNKRDYTIHKFNGKEITIQVSATKAKNKFCYNKYTHVHHGIEKSAESGKGFKLGNIEYNNQCIQDQSKLCTCITSVLDESQNKYTTASEVVVYYYKGDPNHQNPLLVVLCSENNCTNSKQYYELQKSTTTTTKMYAKQSKPLNLDDSKGGKLEQLLDRILFNISKRLQILLDKRPDPIKLCPSKRLRFNSKIASKPCHEPNEIELGYQLVSDIVFDAAEIAQSILTQDSLFHKDTDSSKEKIFKNCEQRLPTESNPKIKTRTPTYPARVYNNTGKREQGPAGTTQIKVQKIESIELANTGYVCYRHKLLNIPNINEFNGLRLFLWDNRASDDNDQDCKITQPNPITKHKCCELDLYKDNSPVQPIAYTTCKGDLYVYFYGSDPRPMLLCYNGQSYAPQSMDEYNKKWCLIKQIPSCECSEKGFQASQDLLKQLYKTSMFLNPVNLWETLEAYKKVKPEVTRIRKDKKEGKEVPKLGNLPEHVYTVQTFGDTEIRVRVKSSDLQCYRKYTHTPAMAEGGTAISRGYRLGSIFYGSDQKSQRDADKTCLSYPNHQRLQSVSLYYYMYDSEHRYPLIIQLDYGFSGELDDYYRVCNISAGAGQPGPNGGGSSNGGGSNGGTTTTTPSTEEIAKAITWVKLKCPVTDGEGHVHSQDDSGQAQTGSAGSCSDDCPKPTDYTGKPIEPEKLKELTENDARFVKEAHMVQGKIRDLSQGEPTYGNWYMDVSSLFNHYYMDYVAELQALIEARCYDVRRKYEIKYEPKDESTLVLATDDNCYEESIMGYVLGGGALGVAGGGGWKLATFVLTLFIKV